MITESPFRFSLKMPRAFSCTRLSEDDRLHISLANVSKTFAIGSVMRVEAGKIGFEVIWMLLKNSQECLEHSALGQRPFTDKTSQVVREPRRWRCYGDGGGQDFRCQVSKKT